MTQADPCRWVARENPTLRTGPSFALWRFQVRASWRNGERRCVRELDWCTGRRRTRCWRPKDAS